MPVLVFSTVAINTAGTMALAVAPTLPEFHLQERSSSMLTAHLRTMTTNLAMDRGRREELRKRFDDLRAIEEVDYAPIA